jgi:hypothetical protein
MSKILRRPMFRGGPVSSYNTGITSGLGDEGYANGGRVGFQGGGFNYLRDTGFGRSLPGIYEYGIKEPLAALYNMVGVPLNITSEFFTGYNPGFSGERFFNLKNRPSNKAELFGIKTDATPGMTYRNQDLIDSNKKYQESTDEVNKFIASQNKSNTLNEEKRTEMVKKEKPNLLNDEEDMKKQTELYQKLLGGDEAKKQSIYDALLAASPAFFKGKNLREAAPEVLTAINKSGAFDKPRDIKQAAAQLAIQRQIMKDKAVAEERSRLEYLRLQQGFKEPSVTDRLVKLGAQESFGGNLPSDVKKAVPGKYYLDANGKLIKVIQDPKTKQIDFIEFPD